MKAQLISILCACIMPVLAWLAGYNFDSRGIEAVCTFLMTIIVYGVAMAGYHLVINWYN